MDLKEIDVTKLTQFPMMSLSYFFLFLVVQVPEVKVRSGWRQR